MPKIKINQDTCIGCGACVATCPKSFRLNDNMKAEAIKENIKAITCEKEAADSCPVGAIEIKN